MNKSMQTKPSIVFCHGIWADGSCFSKVIPALQADGYEVMAAQYGLDTNEGDVATVRRTLGRVSRPAILVGHSYGGSVITAAGTDDRVAGLVYIAALAPDADETSQSQQEKFPVTDVFKYVEVTDGRVWMRPEGVACFAGDLSEEDQKVVWATHYAPAADLFSRNAPGTAWKSKPSWYIVANHDRSPSGPGTLLGEADGRYHLCCRQQPRRDAFPSQPGHRRYPCRRKGRSRIIRYGVRCVAATTADTKV